MNTKLLIGSIVAALLVLFLVTSHMRRSDTAAADAQPPPSEVRVDTPDQGDANNDTATPRVSQIPPPASTSTAEPAGSIPAPLLLEPEYESPTYLDLRDEATRKGAGYESGRLIRTRIARVNWEVLAAAVQAVEGGARQLSPPLELSPFDSLHCRLSSPSTVQTVRPGHLILLFSGCDENVDSRSIMLNINPDERVFTGMAEIQGSVFHLGRLSQGYAAVFQVNPSTATLRVD